MIWAARRGSTRKGLRFFLSYAGIIGTGIAVVLLFVLPAGDRVREARQAPPLVDVGGAAARCLGERLAVAQSGVFVELHVPRPRRGGGDGQELAEPIGRGRVDPTGGAFRVNGTCPRHSPLGGARFAGRGVLLAAAGPAHEPGDVAGTGRLVVAGMPPLDLALDAADPEVEGASAPSDEQVPRAEVVGRTFLAVAVLVIVARLLGTAFTLIRQPRVLGEIVAGILLGPSLLGALLPDAGRYLFPPEVTDALEVMAQFGLIFFMFLVGLGLDLSLARGYGHGAVLISHASIIVPFTLGAVTALVLYPLVGSGSLTGFSLFLGAAMAITAFPVLARILTETGLFDTRLGVLSIACAAVDDVSAWCILAVVVGVVKSRGGVATLETLALSALFVALMFTVVRRVLRRMVEQYRRRESRGAVLAAITAAILLSAWATEAIGAHAIFGAFLLGLIVPRAPDLVADMTDKLEPLTSVLLLPIFFGVVGLSTSIGLLRETVQWLLVALIIVVAIVGKWGGSMLAARLTGLPWREANALGILMNTRGLTEIVILTVGRALGVVSPVLFTMMVLMALFTTFMATPLLAVMYPPSRRGEEVDVEAAESGRAPSR